MAAADPAAAHMHEWRKRVKDFWYHQRLLEEAWPTVMRAQAKSAHALSTALGDHHDLTVLPDSLANADGPLAAGIERDEVLELARQRRAELEQSAMRCGRRLFTEPPKAYGRRLKRYLDAAASEEPLGAATP